MIPAALGGLAGGLAILIVMHRAGLLTQRSGLAVLVAAIAAFYPVFAVQAEAELTVIAIHTATFIGFSALAITGFRKGSGLLAAALVAHGVFDLAMIGTGHPGPIWWPAFCGALDIAAGAGLFVLIRQGSIT